jgi:hypothetical protein
MGIHEKSKWGFLTSFTSRIRSRTPKANVLTPLFGERDLCVVHLWHCVIIRNSSLNRRRPRICTVQHMLKVLESLYKYWNLWDTASEMKKTHLKKSKECFCIYIPLSQIQSVIIFRHHEFLWHGINSSSWFYIWTQDQIIIHLQNQNIHNYYPLM